MGQDSNPANTNVTELIGPGAIIVSLVFVGLEVRQNTIATRAVAYQQHGEHVSNQWTTYAMDPGMVRLFSADERDWGRLTDIEKQQITFAWAGRSEATRRFSCRSRRDCSRRRSSKSLVGGAFTPGYQMRMLWPQIAAYLNP